MFVYNRKKHHRSMKRLTSPLDSRFGSKSISTPNCGSYGNPYTSPPIQAAQTFNSTAISPDELRALGLEMPNFSKLDPISRGVGGDGWQDAHAHLEATRGQLPTYTAIPAHHAYIPAAHAPISPATSTNTNTTYQVSSNGSSRSSPKNLPPPIKVPPRHVQASAPREIPTSQLQPAQKSQLMSINTKVPGATGLPQFPSPEDRQPKIQISIDTKIQEATGLPCAPTPQDGVLPQFPSRATATPQQTQLPQFQTAQQEMRSQIVRPGLHSQQQAFQSTAFQTDNRPPSRTGSWKRSGSRGTIRDNSTERTTAGGWKRSGSRGSIRASSKERPAAPVRISGPMIKHGGRFDFEAAEQEMREREESIKLGPDKTPSSAESAEQWPGSY
jgi:hypothetical protein